MNTGNFLPKLTYFCGLGFFESKMEFYRDFRKSKVVTLLGVWIMRASISVSFLVRYQTRCIPVATARCEICRIYSNRIFSSPTKRPLCKCRTFFTLWCCHCCITLTGGTLFRLSIIDFRTLLLTRYDEVTITSYICQFHPLWDMLSLI